MSSEHILLRNRGDVVGFGKFILNPETSKPSTVIHGHDLKQFAKRNEELVAIHGIQIFAEFEDQPYPYSFRSFDDLPVLLGDLNKSEKSFKQVISWDKQKITSNPNHSLTTLGDIPRIVSASILNQIRDAIQKSPSKVRFAARASLSVNEILPETRQRVPKPIYRSYFVKSSSSTDNSSLDYLRDAYNDSDEEGLFEKRQTAYMRTGNDTAQASVLDVDDCTLRATSAHNGTGHLTLSGGSYEKIQSSISSGTFDESIDQIEEEMESLKERSQRITHSRRNSHDEVHRRSSESFVRDAETVRHKRHQCLSPSERIIKRFKKQQRKTQSRLENRSCHNERFSGNARNQRSDRSDDFSRNSTATNIDGRQTYRTNLGTTPTALCNDTQENPANSAPHPASDSNSRSTSELSQSSSEEDGDRLFRLINHHVPQIPSRDSFAEATHYQPSLLSIRQQNPDSVPSLSLKPRSYRFKTREKAPAKTVGKRKATRMVQLQQSHVENPFKATRPCCKAGCFDLMDPDYAVIQYRRFLKMDRKDRKRALKSMYIRRVGAFWFGGIYVCTRFLARGLGFSNHLQCAVKGTPKARASSSIEATPRQNFQETKKNKIILYLRDIAERIGDNLPTKPHVNLPLMTKKQVFEKFKKFNLNLGQRECPSLSYWCDVWKDSCSDIKTHRHHGFTVCDMCENIRTRFETAENEQIESHLRKLMEDHYRFVEEERRDYERRRDLSKRYPTKYLSLIIDGADQKSYGLPHFVFSTKEDKGHKMKMKIVGVLQHGIQKQLKLFTLTEEFESGANHIIEALHRVIGSIKAKNGKLPPVLFVQADNCTRENKNRFLLSYLEMLVRKGVFREVCLSFLPIGHTHSDIDQAFSSVAARIKIERAITLEDMINLLAKCYSPRAHAEQMNEIANFSGLCKNTRCIRNVNGFSQFRFFRIKLEKLSRRPDGSRSTGRDVGSFVTTIDVKIQCSDDWAPLDKSLSQSGFLKFTPDLRNTPVTDTSPPDNVLEVNKHFRSCEHRMQSNEKLKMLENLRDRVYTRRRQPFHWNLDSCFEENGDYRLEGDTEDDTDLVSNQIAFGTADAGQEVNGGGFNQNYSYSLNFFIAVKTTQDCPDPFWIARTLRVSEFDDEGNPKKLMVRWFQARDAEDVFKSVYVMSNYMKDGTRTVFDDFVDVRSILCEFESLNSRGELHTRTQKAIRQTMNLN